MPEAGQAPLLVIGATGQIGEFLLARTAHRRVIALARKPEVLPDRPHLRALAFDAGRDVPDEAADARAAVSTLPVWQLPPLFDRFAAHGVRRLVCFSTSSVLGKASTSTARERAVVARVADAEAALRAAAAANGVALTILRPTLIYGTGRDRTVASAARFIRRFGFYPVYGAARGARQPVHADDLAAAALQALEAPQSHGRTYALGGGETLPYRDVIARIFTVLERSPRLIDVPGLPHILAIAGALVPGSELSSDVARRMNLDLAFDDGAAAAAFGYAPRAFLAGGMRDLFGPDNDG